MSNAKHTPGPWEACIQDADTGEKWFDIWSASHGSIAHVSEFARPDENLRSFRADARLIAAAPELLEALKDASCTLTSCDGAEMEYEVAKDLIALLKRINAAITKAEGGAE